MTHEELESLKDLFSDKPIDKEWEQMMEEAHRNIEAEEPGLEFEWDVEERNKPSLKIEPIIYEPLDIPEINEEDIDRFASSSTKELDQELLGLFA